MAPEMQLVITENKQIINTVATTSNSYASDQVKWLQEFQQLVNATLTKIIEERGGSNQDDNEDLLDDDSEADEDALPVTPKKIRK